jgi:hypothetical protein
MPPLWQRQVLSQHSRDELVESTTGAVVVVGRDVAVVRRLSPCRSPCCMDRVAEGRPPFAEQFFAVAGQGCKTPGPALAATPAMQAHISGVTLH